MIAEGQALGRQPSQTIKTGEPLWLNQRETTWIVQSGSMAIYASASSGGQTDKTQRYLFRAEPGDLLIGMQSADGRTLVGFANEDCILVAYSLADISEFAAQANPTAIAEIDGWMTRIISPALEFPAPQNGVDIPATGTIEVPAGSCLRSGSGPVPWIRSDTGTARLWDTGAFLQQSDVRPMPPGVWFMADTPLAMTVLQLSEVKDAATIRNGLAWLEKGFFQVVATLDRLSEESRPSEDQSAYYAINRNEPLSLNRSDTCWIVHSGSMAVYSAAHRYLFSANPGDLLMGVDSDDGAQLVAYASEDSTVRRYWTIDIAEYAAQGNRTVLREIEDWIEKTSAVGLTVPASEDAVDLAVEGVIELNPGRYLRSPAGRVSWVRSDFGSAKLLGIPDVILPPGEVWPIVPGRLLYSDESLVLTVLPSHQVGDAAAILNGLRSMEKGFSWMLANLEQPQQTPEAPAQPTYCTITGNEPLLLNERDMCWVVQSGSMALFAATVRDGKIEGARRYLFNAEPGDLLIGMQPEGDRILIAVPVEESTVYPSPLTTISSSLARADFTVIGQIENWISKVGSVAFGFACPSDAIEVKAVSTLEANAGQYVHCPAGRVRWLSVNSGSAGFLGMDDVTLQPGYVFPIAPGTWLHAESPLVLSVLQTSQLGGAASINEGLRHLEKGFFRVLMQLDRRQHEENWKRSAERQQLNVRLTRQTITDLARVALPFETVGPSQEGSPIVVAARMVAHALGVTIRTMPDDILTRDPLRAIAQSSDIRIRKVVLSGGWWRTDSGPLCGFLTEGERPVALLPTKRSLLSRPAYEIFDPASGTRTIVTPEKAGMIAPVAYTFYRPLPEKTRALDLVKFALKGHARDLAMVVIAGLAVTALGMLTPLATSILFESAIPDGDKRLVLQLGLALGAAAIGSILFELTQSMSTLRIETGTSAALQSGVWDRLLKLSPPFFRQFTSGDLELRAEAVSLIRAQLSGATLHAIFSGLASLLNMGLMFSYSPTLATAALAISAVVLMFTVGTAVATKRQMKPAQDMVGNLFGIMVELISLVPKLRIAGAEERAFAHWGKAFSRQQKMMQGVLRTRDLQSVTTAILPLISSAVLFWYAAESLHAPEATSLSVGVFLAFNVAFGTYLAGLLNLSQTGLGLIFVGIQWGRAKTILEAEPEVSSVKAHPGKLSGRLAVEHVTFRYRHDGPLTLEDVTIHAGPGECIAIVGPSGSGKSTLLSLMLRFEIPESGAIYFDGQDLAGLDVHAVRRQLGVVMQDNKIMAGSIFENLACGGVCTMDDAWEAARNAGLADDLAQMPMGMHTMVSEGGGNVSGGQRQRILIARALIFNPSVLIFDEATSALDNHTQAIVTESLNRLQVTRILVAHRLSTIRQADRIYVMDMGRVVQQGTFEELAGRPGLFAQLMARQTVGAVAGTTA